MNSQFSQAGASLEHRATTIFCVLVIAYVWARLCWYIWVSFSWPMDGDLSFLYYIANLMNEHGYVPYRDVHETSFFGTFIFYSLLTSIIGYSTWAFHAFDLIFFLVLGILLFQLLKPLGKFSALLAVGLFGEMYYSMGIGVHLQRDFVALLPAAIALILSQSQTLPEHKKYFSVGALFAVASCIKPQFALGASVVVIAIWWQHKETASRQWQQLLAAVCWSLAGFVLIWLMGWAWLVYHNITAPFLDMVLHYLPAYSSINGRNFAREETDAWVGAYKWMRGALLVWVIPIAISTIGVFLAKDYKTKSKQLLILILLLWIIYLAYVPMAGKYWKYHILPSHFYLTALLACILAKPVLTLRPIIARFGLFGIWLVLFFYAIINTSWLPKAEVNLDLHSRLSTTTNQLTEFLHDNLQPGDTVQPHTTHTRGPIFPSLLSVSALPATPYLENYLLFHDLNSEFVKQARIQFMDTLQQSPPRFIIYTPSTFSFSGPETEKRFKRFEWWLQQNYRVALESTKLPEQSVTEKFIVYELKNKP